MQNVGAGSERTGKWPATAANRTPVDVPLPRPTYAQAMRLAQDKPTAGGHGGPPAGRDTGEQAPPQGTPGQRDTGGGTPQGEAAVPGADAVFQLASAGFHSAVDDLAGLRSDIVFDVSPAPRRIAPYATAIEAAVYAGDRDDDDEIASGRLILLHDPDGQPGWTGTFRLVTLVRADVEEEMASDPLLGAVGWSWLTDALALHAPGYSAPSGTVTRVITEGFGGKSGEPSRTEFELRASWSPPEDTDLGVNVAAWCDVLAAAAGLPAQPPGTTALRPGKPRDPGPPAPGGRRR